MPDPMELPEGCKFADRCKHCTEACGRFDGEATRIAEDHWVKCLLHSNSEEVKQ